MKNPFQGLICPILTPFDSNGGINFQVLQQLIDSLILKGVPCLMTGGTTGEGMLLTTEERMQLSEAVVMHISGRAKVIVHTGSITTKETLTLTRHAQEIGADGISAITPYFFSYSDEEIYRYYEAIAKSVPDMPVSLYCFPGNAKHDIKTSLLTRIIIDMPNVKALKSSNPDLIRFAEYVNSVPQGVSILCGVDALTLPALTLGSRGQVSGNSNVFPEPFLQLFNAYQSGNNAEASKHQTEINHIRGILKDSIAYFKAAADILGIPVGDPRLPMQPLNSVEKMKLKSDLQGLNLL
ncbi:MAG: dihydrodipicolinate synthase family protein [Anaerolineaceae bacterium]